MHPSRRAAETGALYTTNDTFTTTRYFEKYNIPEIKREFYRLNYSDASQNIFNGSSIFGYLAIILAAINIFGGFLVTQRMLAMYKKKNKNK